MENKQILELVEWLAGGEEWGGIPPEERSNAQKLLVEIYKIVHSHREDHCCSAVHAEWREEAEKIYEENKKYF